MTDNLHQHIKGNIRDIDRFTNEAFNVLINDYTKNEFAFSILSFAYPSILFFDYLATIDEVYRSVSFQNMTNVFKAFRDEVFIAAKSYKKLDNLETKYRALKDSIIEVAKQTNTSLD